MGDAIKGMSASAYALISGPVFNFSFAFMMLFSGPFADTLNRKIIISTAATFWSLTSVSTAFCQVFWQVTVFRLLLGGFEAFTAPTAYSLITDFFPPEKRAFANSVYALGISAGASIS